MNEDFDGASAWAGGLRAPSPFPSGGGYGRGEGSGGIEVGDTVRVGEYEVTPIRADADAGAEALNTWLRTNRFPPANEEAVRAYAREGATFLAVEARVPRGTIAMDLRPNAIAFRSAQVVLPVRLSAGDAPFGLNATLISTRVPNVVTGLAHGLSASPLHGPDAPPMEGPVGLVSLAPQAAVPAEMRQLIESITSSVPGFERMLTGTVGVSLLAAQPLRISVGEPDPAIALGTEIATDAPAGVAHEGHWTPTEGFVLGPEVTESDGPAAPPPPVAPAPTTAEASAASVDDGWCSATGRPDPALWFFALLVPALAVMRGRRRRG